MIILAFMAGWYFNEKSGEILPVITKNEAIKPEVNSRETEDIPADTTRAETDREESATGKDKPREPENSDYTAVPFTAESNLTEKENEILTSVVKERYTLAMLKRIEVFTETQQPEGLFVEKEKSELTDRMSRGDEILIAENVRSLENNVADESKWKMGLNVSPGYSSQTSNYSESYSNNMTYSGDAGNGNISGGLSVQFKTGKRWSVESGVYYAQNGQKSSNSLNFQADRYNSPAPGDAEKSYFNTTVNLVNGQIAMNSNAGIIQFSGTPVGTEMVANLDGIAYSGENILLNSGEFSQVFEFVEIPLYLRYNILDSKVGIDIMGGVNAGIVTGNNVFMENQYGTQNIGKTRDISTVNLSGTIGVGVNYTLGKHISMAVEPRFNVYLNSINQNPDVEYRPYRIGIYTGLYYEF